MMQLAKKVSRIGKGLGKTAPAMLVKRIARRPFDDDATYVIIHTSHHKVGTSWFRCVFERLSEEFGVPVYNGRYQVLPKDRRVLCFQSPAIIPPSSLPAYRGSHMIRDPRDVVISGYHYHLWTTETWARVKIRDFARMGRDIRTEWPLLPLDDIWDMTYQEYLNSLSREDGIRAEIQRSSTTSIKEIVEWDYGDKNIFEFKYEEIMQHEREVFRSMFRHFGFREAVLGRAVEVAQTCSFNQRTGRDPGQVAEKSHHRSGKLRQWEQEFSSDHRAYFKTLHGQDLVRLGYETGLDW